MASHNILKDYSCQKNPAPILSAGFFCYFFFFAFVDDVLAAGFEVFFAAGFLVGFVFFAFTGVFAFLAGAFAFVVFFAATVLLPFEDGALASFFLDFCPFSCADASTNLSTVQPTLTETASSPGFTSTTTSPLVA